MNWLAIDTSTEIASVALLVGNDMSLKTEAVQKTQAKIILPLIDSLLSEAGISLAQLDGIVLGEGPGSFTGLRIACSVVKGLAFAHDLNVIPVSTLASIAYLARQKVNNNKASVLAVLDARMKELYWGYYQGQTYAAQNFVTPASQITLPLDEPFILAGVGIDVYQAEIDARITNNSIETVTVHPCASAMIYIALEAGLTPMTAESVSPIYVRNQVTQGA